MGLQAEPLWSSGPMWQSSTSPTLKTIRSCIFQDVFLQTTKLSHVVQKRNVNSEKTPQNALEDITLNVKLKLASLWASFMFLYIYVDYFHLYMPGSIEDILAGKVFTFDISYVFLLIAMIGVTIPVVMIFLSVALPAKGNRWTNIIVATIYIPYMLFNLAGEAWVHMYFAAAVEVILLCLIIRYAWKWPQQKA